jgi:hypothetical protein
LRLKKPLSNNELSAAPSDQAGRAEAVGNSLGRHWAVVFRRAALSRTLRFRIDWHVIRTGMPSSVEIVS